VRIFISTKVSDEQRERLKAAGFEMVAFPLIRTVPVDFEPEEVHTFRPDFIVISSKNGAKHFFSRISPKELETAKFIAVGSSTADRLRKLGLEPFIPENFSGEGLVELLKGFNLENKRFLIVRPRVARKVVSQFLREKGAEVKELITYETVPDASKKELLEKELKEGFDINSFTSPSNFKAFLELGKKLAEDTLKKCKLVPIGHVTAEALEKKGFKVWKTPSVYTVDGIIDIILSNHL